MAEIRITATGHGPAPGGPDLPLTLHATVRQRSSDNFPPHTVLSLHLGNDTVEIWPLDTEYVRELGRKLIAIADTQDAKTPHTT